MNTRRAGRAVFLFALFFMVFQTGTALAQNAPQTDLPDRRVVVWINPILAVFTWYIGEVEIRLQENHTVGVSSSYLKVDTDDPGDPDYEETEYFAAQAFYRYYPTASFKGFFIGGQIGVVRATYKDNFEDNTGNATSAGVLIGYGWLLGDDQRVGVSIGVGANRLFGGDVDDDVTLTLPVIRLINVGVAF